jgi:hypothetical protein
VRFTLALVAVLVSFGGRASAQSITPVPDLRGLAGPDATACAHAESAACVRLADARLRLGDGTRANVLYRRGADLARDAMHVPARRDVTGPVRGVVQAVATLEANWDTTIVRAAARSGSGDLAREARAQLFGPGAVSEWTGHRARVADAFAAVHTMTEREGGAFAANAWLGELRILASDGPCWEVRFAYTNLDFVAFVDDAGRILAVVHPPEG